MCRELLCQIECLDLDQLAHLRKDIEKWIFPFQGTSVEINTSFPFPEDFFDGDICEQYSSSLTVKVINPDINLLKTAFISLRTKTTEFFYNCKYRFSFYCAGVWNFIDDAASGDRMESKKFCDLLDEHIQRLSSLNAPAGHSEFSWLNEEDLKAAEDTMAAFGEKNEIEDIKVNM